MQCPTFSFRCYCTDEPALLLLFPHLVHQDAFLAKEKTNQWVYSSSNGRFKYMQLRAGWGPSSLAKLLQITML